MALSIGSDQLFAGLLDAIGQPELKDDPRFRTMADRAGHREQTDRLVADWVARHSTAEVIDCSSSACSC